MAYVDAHREVYGVVPICLVLSEHGIPIAPSTYYDARRRTAAAPTPAQRRDEELCHHIRRVHAENFGVYGARKVWLQLNREGIAVARCTVERLMKQLGVQGVRRGRGNAPRSPTRRPHGRGIWSAAGSARPRRTCCGWPT